jgi:hypothetical protein
MSCLAKSPTSAERSLLDLAARFAVLLDPRDRRGRCHGLASVLLTACVAVFTGAKSFAVVGQ